MDTSNNPMMSDPDSIDDKPDTISERDINIQTKKLDTDHLNPTVYRRAHERRYAHPERELTLFLPGESDPLTADVSGTISVGRTDPRAGIYPGIDLSPYHAGALGVSRFHAEISRSYGKFYIKDMGSTNGTRVNGIKIAPYRLVPFRSGDQLRLGHLMMIVG